MKIYNMNYINCNLCEWLLLYFYETLSYSLTFYSWLDYNKYRKWRNHKRGLPGYMLKNTSPGQDRCVFLLVIFVC